MPCRSMFACSRPGSDVMAQFAPPVLFGLFVWWFSTGAVLYLVRIENATLVNAAATMVLAASAIGLMVGKQLSTVAGAYLAFACAILVWSWAEITFLSGLLTGPKARPCPPSCTGFRRAGHAINAILYHELALLALAILVVTLTWGGSNQTATATFLILWTMRLSAKLNLFLGVPILNEEFLPRPLDHLKTFFVRRATNILFPIAVTSATVAASWLVMQAVSAGGAFEAAQHMLLATLLGLAIIEHWFMVVPLPVSALWQWGMRSGQPPQIDPAEAAACPDPIRNAEREGICDRSGLAAAPLPALRPHRPDGGYRGSADPLTPDGHKPSQPLLAN
jgi:putative photosynthetic complex assembly protein 2